MRKAAKVSIAVMIFGLSWIVYNYFVTTPAHNAKMSCFDQKGKLLDQKMLALDQGNQELADKLQLQIDNIQGC
jgi:hypothetical protein